MNARSFAGAVALAFRDTMCTAPAGSNHASVIDGIRLRRAQRHRYEHGDMADLGRALKEARDARTWLIATDGVFSVDGDVAPLAEICALADRYGALVMVDDSHATGFFGPTGRGTPEHCGVNDPAWTSSPPRSARPSAAPAAASPPPRAR
jgi:7-keto-8-aminopelargonate synthetase-like enzyme